jgi:hypothetical protein
MRCLHLQDQKVSQANNQHNGFYFCLLGFPEYHLFFLGLIIDPEEAGSTSSGTSINFYRTTRRHSPENIPCYSHPCGNLKLNKFCTDGRKSSDLTNYYLPLLVAMKVQGEED